MPHRQHVPPRDPRVGALGAAFWGAVVMRPLLETHRFLWQMSYELRPVVFLKSLGSTLNTVLRLASCLQVSFFRLGSGISYVLVTFHTFTLLQVLEHKQRMGLD